MFVSALSLAAAVILPSPTWTGAAPQTRWHGTMVRLTLEPPAESWSGSVCQ